MSTPDPVELTASLVRCPSVTPQEGGAIALLEALLSEAGFDCRRADRNGIANLHARFGTRGPVFGFNGHTDVVPPGEGWSGDPFSGEMRDGKLWGRGATDMKSGVAAFVAAAIGFVRERPEFGGSIALLITGDEEGDATDGTVALLDWMSANGETLDVCLVGEPTCPERFGEMIKIGRRGSMTAKITATGTQGHAAYPDRARNPLPPLLAYLHRLASWRLDTGTAHFEPSTLAITTVDTGNPANNVIPGRASATVNIRFNDAHDSALLTEDLRRKAEDFISDGIDIAIETKVSGESFVTEPGAFTELVGRAIQQETGDLPESSTSGGTSDARFIQAVCPVVEFGLVGKTMHKADEHVEVEHIRRLTQVYRRILENYFATA